MNNDSGDQQHGEEQPTRRQFFSAVVGSGGMPASPEVGRRAFLSFVGKVLLGLVALVLGGGLFGNTPKADAVSYEWYWWIDPWGRRRRRRRRRHQWRRRNRRRGRRRRRRRW